MNTKTGKAFLRLVEIMNELREKCPWDRKQTIQSLRQMTIEETYELADAITNEDWQGIKEELGDLLLHILFYSKIGEEEEKEKWKTNSVMSCFLSLITHGFCR